MAGAPSHALGWQCQFLVFDFDAPSVLISEKSLEMRFKMIISYSIIRYRFYGLF